MSRWVDGGDKYEIRSTKSETNSKSEFQMSKSKTTTTALILSKECASILIRIQGPGGLLEVLCHLLYQLCHPGPG